MRETYYSTKYGQFLLGDSIELIKKKISKYYRNRINLIITSPPFPLNQKKRYGNLNGDEYKEWFINLAPLFSELLTEDGSIVIELGNSWEPGRPVQSLLHMESLLGFVKHPDADLRLCQEFICYNPARLPSPAPWVTIDRIRTIDSYTHVWWISRSDNPKANNANVLRPYSKSMKRLLKRERFNPGKRPSQHDISPVGFLKDHNGSIMPNVIDLEPSGAEEEWRIPQNVLRFSNTTSNDHFLRACRENKTKPHPARMAPGLVSFFVNFLTDEGDKVFDPFAGSNTTGFVAEIMQRNWLASEMREDYANQALLRFGSPEIKHKITTKK